MGDERRMSGVKGICWKILTSQVPPVYLHCLCQQATPNINGNWAQMISAHFEMWTPPNYLLLPPPPPPLLLLLLVPMSSACCLAPCLSEGSVIKRLSFPCYFRRSKCPPPPPLQSNGLHGLLACLSAQPSPAQNERHFLPNTRRLTVPKSCLGRAPFY